MSFKLPDFLNWSLLDNLRNKMGAQLTSSFSLEPVQSDSAFVENVETNLDEVKVHDDGTLQFNNKRILLHIRDISPIAGEVRMPKYHLANCQILEKMRRNSRFDRYVVANRDTGEFQVNILGNSRETQTVKLKVCQSCLDRIRWHGFSMQSMPSSERWSRVTDFSLADFFKEYPRDLIGTKPSHSSLTAPLNDYSQNWAKLSKEIRQKRGHQCESCKELFSQDDLRFLHVHHRNGLKNDNRNVNLAVLCIACHAQQPEHGHLKRHPDYKLLMARQKH